MSGILNELFKQVTAMGLPIKPQVINNELTIEFTEEQFKEATTKNLDERMKNAITIQFRDGKMIIKIKLF